MIQQNNYQIGGNDQVVEIDESLVAKRKYHQGHFVPERWIFGGICPASGRGFLVQVPDRTAAILLPIIQQRIAPGSTICSDMWAAYNGIANLPGPFPYTHMT
ncbi:MAG: hypothetical protein AAF242_20845, partial [Bacteroidota bacterium]